MQAQKNQNEEWAANSYELVIMNLNSGEIVNERGTSSTFLSLLTKQDVLNALQRQPYSNFEVRRLVRGGFLDNIGSAVGWIQKANCLLPRACWSTCRTNTLRRARTC